jgi:cytochrome b
MLAGQALMALLLFRLVWGFVGSETARFSHFLKNPLEGLRHLAHFGRREPDTTVGHNEAGGWMVLALLLVLLAQVLTGMFLNNEESFVEGPLARLVSSEWGAWAMRQHHLIFNVIQVLVLGHVAAVILYGVVKRHDLVRPMITGKKRLPAATRAPRMASPVLAAVILAACAALVWAVVNLL